MVFQFCFIWNFIAKDVNKKLNSNFYKNVSHLNFSAPIDIKFQVIKLEN